MTPDMLLVLITYPKRVKATEAAESIHSLLKLPHVSQVYFNNASECDCKSNFLSLLHSFSLSLS